MEKSANRGKRGQREKEKGGRKSKEEHQQETPTHKCHQLVYEIWEIDFVIF